tara:strand:+ start:485 stop:1015 length:531 start_codon:yes stop_codon:yes gene_type:complete
MAIDKIQSESINLADNFAFTGTVTGAGGVNTPCFSARKSDSNQSLSNGSYTKITFNNEVYDVGNCYASDRFTVPSGEAGKYVFSSGVMISNNDSTNTQYVITAFYVNGTQATECQIDFRNNYGGFSNTPAHSLHLNLSVGDYVEVYGAIGVTSGTTTADSHASRHRTYFQGFKLID